MTRFILVLLFVGVLWERGIAQVYTGEPFVMIVQPAVPEGEARTWLAAKRASAIRHGFTVLAHAPEFFIVTKPYPDAPSKTRVFFIRRSAS